MLKQAVHVFVSRLHKDKQAMNILIFCHMVKPIVM